MKKVLAGIAILAFVAAAQAELLNTWTFSGGRQSDKTPNTSAQNYDQVEFGDLTLVNLTPGATGAVGGKPTFSSYNWTADSAIQFTVNVNPDYKIEGAGVTVQGINNVNNGPTPLQWKLGTTGGALSAVGDAWTVATGTDAQTTQQSVSFGDIAAGNYTAALTYSGTGRVGSTTAAASSTANVRIFTNMQFTGDIKAAGDTPTPPAGVPEPATMSLLGLGALAMVVRKLRK